MGSLNFTDCANKYVNNSTLIALYGWTGPVRGIPRNASTQISYEGCKMLCGPGTQFYPWSKVAGTMTTWVFPVIGVILQASFESNAFWNTVFALARWIGSPMVSLSYILWNIKVTGKCALLVDLAISYEEPIPDLDSDYGSIRDSFYILTTINQFAMRPSLSVKREAEGLLRIVLFSKDLQLLDKNTRLATERQRLAKDLREARKRGVVPVFISTLWFLFSLAISIQSAFDMLGESATAHDLSLGLLLAWVPVLILSSIVDRNFVNPEDVCRKLNNLVHQVRAALLDVETQKLLIRSFENSPEFEEMKIWVRNISLQCTYMEDYFIGYAGQGRRRWHYGAAHSIISSIEHNYIAEHGRAWLQYEHEARTKLVLGQPSESLIWFDLRELWQILASVAIVIFTISGAVVLSYYVPTIGLGCRSGGHMIFALISFCLLFLEMLLWWCIAPTKCLDTSEQRLSQNNYDISRKHNLQGYWCTFVSVPSKALLLVKNVTLQTLLATLKRVGMKHRWLKKVEEGFLALSRFDLPQWTERLFFRPLEVVNTIWLAYHVVANTIGSYLNCSCETSSWSTGGGYMDFTQYLVTNSPWTPTVWKSSTAVACLVMSAAMIYIVLEWCLQSHLSTGDYDSARSGLRRTRQFRRLTFPFRYVLHIVINAIEHFSSRLLKFFNRKNDISGVRRSVTWTRTTPASRARTPAVHGPGLAMPLLRIVPPNFGPLAPDATDQPSSEVSTDSVRPRTPGEADHLKSRPTFDRENSMDSTC